MEIDSIELEIKSLSENKMLDDDTKNKLIESCKKIIKSKKNKIKYQNNKIKQLRQKVDSKIEHFETRLKSKMPDVY